MKRLVVLGLIAPLLAGCIAAPVMEQAAPTRPPQVVVTASSTASWLSDDWPTSTPEEQGVDSQRFADMLETIREREYEIDSVTVIRNGAIVADASVYPFQPGSRHIIHSCTKSIVSALIGIAIDQGQLEGLEQPLLEIFSERSVTHRTTGKEAITLEDVLMMASGLECRDSYYRWRGLQQMRQSDDWVQFMLDLPMVDPPGTRFEYCNGGSFLLSAIIQAATGLTAAAFAQEHLFDPLGIQDVEWPANPQGISIGWGEMHMRPHDMAKIGYLYLSQGWWDGEQIVPADWVRASTSSSLPRNHPHPCRPIPGAWRGLRLLSRRSPARDRFRSEELGWHRLCAATVGRRQRSHDTQTGTARWVVRFGLFARWRDSGLRWRRRWRQPMERGE